MECVGFRCIGVSLRRLRIGLRCWRSGTPGTRLRLEDGSLYYAGSVTAEEAARAGHYLVGRGFFNAGLIDARIYRDGVTYQLQLICSSGRPNEAQKGASRCQALVVRGVKVLV